MGAVVHRYTRFKKPHLSGPSSVTLCSSRMKVTLLLVLTLLPLLHAQSLCPVLQSDQDDDLACTDVCIMDMKQTVDISAQYPDYRTYLRKKFEFFHDSCHGCIYVFCGLVREVYGISLAKETCK